MLEISAAMSAALLWVIMCLAWGIGNLLEAIRDSNADIDRRLGKIAEDVAAIALNSKL